MSFKNQLSSEKTLCFLRAKPNDITEEQWELAKAHASESRLSDFQKNKSNQLFISITSGILLKISPQNFLFH
jgi:hypothetical protein